MVRNPTDQIIFSEYDWGVQAHIISMVFRLHYHSQKVIEFLGNTSSPFSTMAGAFV